MISFTGSASLDAIIVLVLGAVLILLFTTPLSRAQSASSYVGLLFAVIATGIGFTEPSGIALPVVAISALTAVAELLAPTFETQLPTHRLEASALLLLGAAGAIALASAGTLLEAAVGLETLALSAVVLVATGRGERPVEAAFKYFVLGAVSFAGLLYGIGLVYLGTGSFAFPTATQVSGNLLVLSGVVLVGLGFAFEFAVFPFHWGGLDAYTAAPPGIAGYVMSASKLGAGFALGRLAFASGAQLGQVLVWIGCLTIVWGTFGAIAQRTSFRRMLGYSAVTHAGFIALAAGSGPAGPAVAGFYAAIYAAMAMLVFSSISGRGTEDISFAQIRDGLSPTRAAGMALGLFSLSGIPPTPGFWAKLAVLVVAWQAGGWVPALIAAAGGVFSVLYYLRPIPDLFATIREAAPTPVGLARAAAVPAMVVAAVFVVALGLFPNLAWTLVGG